MKLDDDKGMPRGRQIAIMLPVLALFLLFFGTVAALLMEPDAQFYLGRRSSTRISLTREQGLAFFIPLLTLLAVTLVVVFWRGLRRTWRTAKPGAVSPELSPGETVLWVGTPGWRSFRGLRIVAALAVIVVPALLLRWMWSITVGPDGLPIKLFFLLFPVWILSCFVLPPIVSGWDTLKAWLWEVFGSIAITRSRIVWLTPIRRRIYRSIAAGEIVDACLNDSDGRRGSVTVIKRRGDDNVESAYLDWLPEPDRAYAAVQALIRYRSPG